MPVVPASVKCKRLHHDATLPRSVSPVALEVCAYLKSELGHTIKYTIPCGFVRSVGTGLSVVPEESYALQLTTPADLAFRGLSVVNTFNSNHPRELIVWLHNGGSHVEWIEHGTPIAQLTLHQLPVLVVEETT